MDFNRNKGHVWRVTPCLEISALVGWLISGIALLWWSQPEPITELPCKCSDADLRVYRTHSPRIECLENGATVQPGDVVQLAYQAHGARYGAILSIDGWGVVTHHLPSDSDRAIPLIDEHEVRLDHAWQLDDAPQFERFWFVSSDSSFPLAPVVDALRTGAEPPPPLRVDQFELLKP